MFLSVDGYFGVVKRQGARIHVVVPKAVKTALLGPSIIDLLAGEHAELHICQNTSKILGGKIFNIWRIFIQNDR